MNKRKVLLLVEDIPKSIKCLRAELQEDEGYLIDDVYSVQAAKEKLSSHEYDAILIDWRLPVHKGGPVLDNGAELLLDSLASGQLGTKNIDKPFIIITAERTVINWTKVGKFKNFVDCVQKLYLDDTKALLSQLFANKTIH
jgi:CheY-like chemotaxis protein